MRVRIFHSSRFLPSAALVLVCTLQSSAQSASDYDRATAAFRSGDYSSAASLFAGVEAASPGTTDALTYEAKSLVHLQNFTGAENALRGYLAIHPDGDEALYLLGFVLHRENKPRESLEIYTEAAARKTPTGDDLKIVALDYVLLNDYTDAIKWLEKAVQLDANNKDAWYYLGRAYYTKSMLEPARKAFETVLALDPHDPRAENNLGLILESQGKPDEAAALYRKAIAWQDKIAHPSEQPYVNLGSLLMDEGRTEESVPFLSKAVELAPNDANCRLKLGTAYLRLARLTEAGPELEKAAQLDPENAAIHYQLGRFYKQVHQIDRAKAEFERTEELQSRAAGGNPQQTPKP
jgi:tetratricopeptide (TPR) repeat protein